MQITIKHVLEEKGSTVWSVKSSGTVYDALKLFADKNIGAVLVMDEGKLSGIFTERDYARKVILKAKSSKDTTVGELMSREVFYVSPSDTVDDCMAIMTDKHVRHVPVLENGRVVGLISIGDVVKQTISAQEFTIQQLKKYISGDM
ncbi:MAG: CBS domain-containing protein [Proteobacteria bacterium]|jgi:CBS domain-containing protein|nr:CBS domain-containing protein [Pseudomonadota bacterium]